MAVIAEGLDRLPGALVERPELVPVREEDAVVVHQDAAMAETARSLAAGGIEAPQLAPGRRVEGEDAELGARRVEHAVDDNRIRLHLRARELVVCLIRPRDLQPGDVRRRDLRERGIMVVVGGAAVHRPVHCALSGKHGRNEGEETKGDAGRHRCFAPVGRGGSSKWSRISPTRTERIPCVEFCRRSASLSLSSLLGLSRRSFTSRDATPFPSASYSASSMPTTITTLPRSRRSTTPSTSTRTWPR